MKYIKSMQYVITQKPTMLHKIKLNKNNEINKSVKTLGGQGLN